MVRGDRADLRRVIDSRRKASRSRRARPSYHRRQGDSPMSADGYTMLRYDAVDRADTCAAVDAPDRLLPIHFGRETCGELAAAERREWWIGNGRGAYAAGTLALSLTRRYHGLLIAPVDPPLGRALVFAKADA